MISVLCFVFLDCVTKVNCYKYLQKGGAYQKRKGLFKMNIYQTF
jgi:hypothetical protein